MAKIVLEEQARVVRYVSLLEGMQDGDDVKVGGMAEFFWKVGKAADAIRIWRLERGLPKTRIEFLKQISPLREVRVSAVELKQVSLKELQSNDCQG